MIEELCMHFKGWSTQISTYLPKSAFGDHVDTWPRCNGELTIPPEIQKKMASPQEKIYFCDRKIHHKGMHERALQDYALARWYNQGDQL